MSGPASGQVGTPTPQVEIFGEHGLGAIARVGEFLRNRWVISHVKRNPGGRVLDIGCGFDANLLRAVRPWAATCSGIDFRVSERALADPALDLREGSLEDLLPTFEDASLDAIFAMSVIEHVEDPGAAFEECHRMLAPGGMLVVHVPTWMGKRILEQIAFRFGRETDSIDDHKQYFNVPGMWPLMVRAGFRPRHLRLRYHTLGCSLLARAQKSHD